MISDFRAASFYNSDDISGSQAPSNMDESQARQLWGAFTAHLPAKCYGLLCTNVYNRRTDQGEHAS